MKTMPIHEAVLALRQGLKVRRLAWDASYVTIRWPTVDPDKPPACFAEYFSLDLVEVVYGADGSQSEHLWGPDNADLAADDWYVVP